MRQVLDGELDQGALDDRQFPLVGRPRRRGPSAGVHAGARRGRLRPRTGRSPWWCARAPGPGQAASSESLSSRPCRTGGPISPAGGAAAPAAAPGWCPAAPAPARAGPAAARPAGQLVAGVEDHQDVRVAVMPVPGGDDPLDDPADLGGGHRGQVVIRTQPDRVQQPGPRRPGPVPARLPASTASPGSSARCFSPARSSGRTTGPGWSAASGRSQLLTSTASRIRPSSPASSGPRQLPSAAARPALSRSSARRTKAPWPR